MMISADHNAPAAPLRKASYRVDRAAVDANTADLDGRTGLRCPPCLAIYTQRLPHPHHRHRAAAARQISVAQPQSPGRL